MITKVLCDTDFIISLFLNEESTHDKAVQIFGNQYEFYALNITMYEVATVLSRKLQQPEAIENLESVQNLFTKIMRITEEDETEIYKLYKSFSKKNISFFDCACQVVATNNNMKIASFDKFYAAELLV
jgi:predicted nucleic acid-binding protein